jgi:O-antigen/teichoic acid export membrane protein
MNQTLENNKRIAKNTLLLYFRMLFMMAISLYTSRVVLNTLGVEDFGIYNVVGGVVSLFVFINNSMASATQRYITFEIGKGDFERLQTIFSTSLQIHILIALTVIALGETVGLWFLYNKMQIPDGRIDAAFWVLQFSIVSTAIMIIRVPYNSDIIAHEKMSVFAYISILEVVLKLLVVFLLVWSDIDKLILYSFLILAVQILVFLCYCYYCHRNYQETKYRFVLDKSLFKEMTGFAGWSMFGGLSAVCFGQGLNLLLNMFFGPIVNAARGISVQVQTAIQNFVSNFQMAINPQITKKYACGELKEMQNLMFRSARFSFMLLLFISLPVLFETNFVLTLWLKIVPDYSVIFLRLMIAISLLYALSNPMIIANQATGKVKKYQAICGSTLILILPIAYICLKLGMPPYSVFIVHFIMELICMFERMILLRPLINVRIKDYFYNVHIKVVVILFASLILPSFAYFYFDEGIFRFLFVSILCLFSVAFSSFLIGLTKNERSFVIAKIKGYR